MTQAGFHDQLDNFCKRKSSIVIDRLKSFVPEPDKMEETYKYLQQCGFIDL
tara:strand:- start:435 stop:587 length:153 start_codon:yes stop_codon:yes gene_type:complete